MKDNEKTNYWETDVYKQYEKKMEEKQKFVKSGPNVIHLEYYGGVILENEILDYEKKLKAEGLELSRFDKNGVMYACIDKFTLVTFIGIAQPLIGELINGIEANATWDVIKYIVISTWKSVRKKTYTRATNQEVIKKEINFGLKVKLDENTSFDFELNGDLDIKTIDKSLNKILTFIENHQKNKNYKRTEYIYFDNKQDEWITVDVETEIRKMMLNGELNKK